MKIMKQAVYFFFFFLILLLSFSSILYLYEKRFLIKTLLFPVSQSKYSTNENDIYWANQIMNGGYILHFRHTERDKWIDVQVYDALESDVHKNGINESRYAENDYFSNAVCLNERGKIQAKAIGEIIKHIGLPIGVVHSSVSCRARQTAELAFGGYDKLHRILVHKGPYFENETERVKKITKLYKSIKIEENKNAIVSSHGAVISCDMFVNDKCPYDMLTLEEGGFYVLKNTQAGLVFEYEFHNFNDFNKIFFKR